MQLVHFPHVLWKLVVPFVTSGLVVFPSFVVLECLFVTGQARVGLTQGLLVVDMSPDVLLKLLSHLESPDAQFALEQLLIF